MNKHQKDYLIGDLKPCLTMASAETPICGRCCIDVIRFHSAAFFICTIFADIFGHSDEKKDSLVIFTTVGQIPRGQGFWHSTS